MATQLVPPPALPHGLIPWPRAGIVASAEPWYAAYVLLAIVQSGLMPVLLPLASGNAAHAGLVIGAMNLAGLAAPVLGHLADSRGWHRRILVVGLLVVAAGLIAMPMGSSVAVHVAAALTMGLGFAGANTVANMFIVETRPRAEWDSRIGTLQAFSGAGQVAGLLLAGLFHQPYLLAFVIAGGLVAAALPIAWRTLGHVGVGVPAATPRAHVTAHPALGAEGCSGGLGRHFHHLSWAGLRDILLMMETPFARLLAAWFIAFVAISAVLTMAPLAMRRLFDAAPGVTASTYAIAAALSIPLFLGAARLAQRFGSMALLRIGFSARVVAISGLAAASLAAPEALMLALGAFMLLVMAWPALAVSGTALAAQLAPVEKGEALGLFNAVSSLAGACGALAGGWAFEAIGYGHVCAVAGIAVLVALFVAGAGRRPQPAAAPAVS